MGCGASNSSAITSNNVPSRPSRPANTTNVPVQRSGPVVGKPLIKSKNYRHGSQITQVRNWETYNATSSKRIILDKLDYYLFYFSCEPPISLFVLTAIQKPIF